MAGLLSWLTSCTRLASKPNYNDNKFKVGQIWNYKTRLGEENSKLTILKVEKYDSAGIVIHVFLDNLKVKNSDSPNGFSDHIGHLPLSKEAMLKSITTLVSQNNKLPAFQAGYNNWKEAFDSGKGGIFSVEVTDAVKYVEEVMNSGGRTEE